MSIQFVWYRISAAQSLISESSERNIATNCIASSSVNRGRGSIICFIHLITAGSIVVRLTILNKIRSVLF